MATLLSRLCLVTALLAVAMQGTSCRHGGGVSKEDRRMVNSVLRNAFIRDVHLQGKIVDEEGNVLTGVHVRIQAHGRGVRERTQIVDGDFDWRFENLADLHLYFRKQGYYDEWLGMVHLEINGTSEDGDALMEHTDMRFVMRSTAGASMLAVENGGPQTPYRGEMKVLLIDRDKDFTYGSYNAASIAADRIEDLPDNCIYVRTDVDDNGALILDENGRPKRVILGVKGKDCGIQLYREVYGGLRETMNTVRSMKDAPEEGYVSEIEIPVKQSQNRYWLYVKCGGLYAKGWGDGCPTFYRENLGGGYLGYGLHLLVQPDGSRNLRHLNTEY